MVEPLPAALVALNYFGDVVFAFSGALVAARNRMDILGIVLIGVVTGLGGGTLRDIVLGHPVWWVENPLELVLCIAAALTAFVAKRVPGGREDLVVWADAVGLSAFAVVGAHVAQQHGAPILVVALLGMMTATGGGVIRDLLTQTRPMILTGEIYATAALVGAAAYTLLSRLLGHQDVVAFVAFALALAVRGSALHFRLRFGIGAEPIITSRKGTPKPPSGNA